MFTTASIARVNIECWTARQMEQTSLGSHSLSSRQRLARSLRLELPIEDNLLDDGEEEVAPPPSPSQIIGSLDDFDYTRAHPPPSLLSGIGLAPKIQRRFHFDTPSLDPPITPLLSSTSTPRIPIGSLPRASFTSEHLRVIDSTLALYPTEFHFNRTIDDLMLEEFLSNFPDQAFAKDVLRSLRSDGFEPPHDGRAALGEDPSSVRFPKQERHRAFIQATIDEEIEKGWISRGTSFPLPGVTYSSYFAVESENHRIRACCDRTASGINDGIDRLDCPTVYDSIVDLIRLLRWDRLESLLLTPSSTLWKLDVSSAFKLLVMSRRWQTRQGIAILRLGNDGRKEVSYHIEWRGVFGCRAMPFLWTRFMSLIVWIGQNEYGIERPLAYMDDAFGCDNSGLLVNFLTPDGTNVRIPQDQQRMATLWSNLGIPFKLSVEKAPSGRCITIVGIQVDLDSFSVSLPEKSVDKLVFEIDQFLATPGRSPPLQKWRQMTGWISWALNVAPQARPYLTPLYQKIAGKTQAKAPVPLNSDVISALSDLRSIIIRSPSLNLASPSLTRWSLADADVVVYTDACLNCDDENGAGLGFWFVVNNRRYVYYSRPGRTYRKIQFAEALTVVRAIEIVTSGEFGKFKRVLVRTDSSAAVYAIDSGSAADGPYLPLRLLTLRSYALASTRGFDLKVSHVAGKDNSLADDLSRKRLLNLRQNYGLDLRQFDPSMVVLEGEEL
jgi:hypothetical protein